MLQRTFYSVLVLHRNAKGESATTMTTEPKNLYSLNWIIKKACTVADPSSQAQHTSPINTLMKNLLHFILQGLGVSVRAVWLWQSKEQLMPPERRLKGGRREQHLSKDVSVEPDSKIEFNRGQVVLRSMH